MASAWKIKRGSRPNIIDTVCGFYWWERKANALTRTPTRFQVGFKCRERNKQNCFIELLFERNLKLSVY